LVTRAADQGVHVRGNASDEAKATYEWGLERFLDEARALATFRHPNIVRVLRYFRENGTAYIVMEYESGLSLKRWLPQNTPLGKQGPWTDIYSLGAVMYWMATGKKPLESASRVKSDGMLPASGLAEPSVFGASLLKAIDWALNPDEGKRPQTVAVFRAAIQGA